MLARAVDVNRRRRAVMARRALAMALAGLTLVIAVQPLATAARPAAARFTGVTTIYQSNITFPDSRFIVQVQVADPSAVTSAYFTFCQLTSSICYFPDVLHHTTGGWFVGNTSQMSQYNGTHPMRVGVRAGYNITIDYANGTNVTEPSLPNQFPGLNVSATVAYQYEYTMIVSPVVFQLTGVVHDSATGAPLSGAKVEIAPGNATTTSTATGAYSFSNLTNGTYSLTVTAAGFPSYQQSVHIAGQDATQNLAVTQTPSNSGGGHSSSVPVYVWGAGGAIAVVLVVAAVVILRRKGPGNSSVVAPSGPVRSNGPGAASAAGDSPEGPA